jgi:nitrite reductase (NO-forming)
MQLRHSRLLAVTAVAGLIALVAAIPALAGSSSHKAASIKVTVNKTKEFAFTLSPKTAAHGAITFTVTNNGNLPHDFELCSKPSSSASATTCTGKKTALISPGASAKLTVAVAKAGTYQYLCTVPGHAAAGMKGLLKVT